MTAAGPTPDDGVDKPEELSESTRVGHDLPRTIAPDPRDPNWIFGVNPEGAPVVRTQHTPTVSPRDLRETLDVDDSVVVEPPQPKEVTSAMKSTQDVRAETEIEDYKQDITLKKHLAYWAWGIASAQLFSVNIIVVLYVLGVGRDNIGHLITTWLIGTFVEIIAIVIIIAKYLFPAEKRSKDSNQS